MIVVDTNIVDCDCEFMAVARSLSVKLVTADGAILAAFPNDAVEMQTYLKA